MDNKNMTVRDLITELLLYPMESPVKVGLLNNNNDTELVIPSGVYHENNEDIWIEDNGYPYVDGKIVYIKGLLKTEEF